MMVLTGLLLLTVFAEIQLASFGLSRLFAGKLNSPLVEAGIVSSLAVILAWLLPFENLLGLTLRSGWFEPWSFGFMVVLWALIGIPAAALWHRRNPK